MARTFTKEEIQRSVETRRRQAAERRAQINADSNKSATAERAKKEAARIPSTVIRWVADQLQPSKEGETHKDDKPPSRAAANLLARCRSSEKIELMFWGKLVDMEKAEAIKKTEAKKMEDDQRESFSLIEMWKREMPGYLERKALHDAAQAQEAEKRQDRARRLAEFQSGGGGTAPAETKVESPAGAQAADAGDNGSAGEGGPSESREEARTETESRAQSEAVAV